MILADKIVRLRKKNGWSQEELAQRMGVSRQTVSKWEGAQAIPEIGKILQLGELLGVTTDYLLKDEIESEEFTGDGQEPSIKRITLGEANAYLEARRVASWKIALATFLCILSPITLLFLGASSELPERWISEYAAGTIGLIVLFLLSTVAVAIFIHCGFKNAPYEFLEKEPFDTEYGVRGMVQERQKMFGGRYTLFNIIGTCVCILSPIPLIASAYTGNEYFGVIMLCVTMLIAGVGVGFFIVAGVRMSAMRRLLQEGEFSESEKKKSGFKGTVSLVYWLTATAIYLGLSLANNNWSASWIVWPIAGVLFAAVLAVADLIAGRKEE